MDISCIAFNNVEFIESKGIELIQFNIFKKFEDNVMHCFTTRKGGVSTGECSSLNFSFKRNDLHKNVIDNYKRLSNALNISMENMVLSDQVHSNKVRVVTAADSGKGLFKESDIIGFDALVTNDKDVALVTIHADCVPIFFYDPVKKAIGLAHSGWKGTVENTGAATVDKLVEAYGSMPKDIIVAIGPSICRDCFEVGDEVKEKFEENIKWNGKYCTRINRKWHIDLKGIIFEALLNKGIHGNNISNSEICTMCNKHMFFSHRGEKGKTGSMAAVMKLKKAVNKA